MNSSSSICGHFKQQDRGAYLHCNSWLPSNTPLSELDQGVLYTDLTNPSEPQAKYDGKSDGIITPQEYYEWTLREINKNPLGQWKRAEELDRLTGIQIPYLFNDYNPLTDADQQIEERAREIILSSNNIDTLILRAGHEWQLSATEFLPTADAIGTILEGGGRCQGIDTPYLGLLLMAGFEVFPQGVSYDERGNPVNHVRLAVNMKDGSTDPYIVDPARPYFGRKPNGAISVPISFSEFIARWHVNQYWENESVDSSAKRKWIETALKLAPLSYPVMIAGIDFYTENNNNNLAQTLFEKATAIFPSAESVLQKKYPELFS